jgi:hemerythrin-like metal-binding protein
MPILEWNDSLNINVRDIDAQHRGLVSMANRLHDGMTSEQPAAMLRDILDEMGQYAVEHFGTEERYMEAHGYPERAAHMAEHRDFADKARRMTEDCASGKCALSMDILNFLCNWLVTHIHGTDKALGAFLNECGVR